MRSRRREIFIGPPGSPPKRIRLEDLEEIVHQIRAASEVIADDLGVPPEQRTPVELVDLLGGSCGLAFEQLIPTSASQAPLAILADAASARARGGNTPKFLTAAALRAVDDTVSVFDGLASRGQPVRVRHYDPAPSPGKPREFIDVQFHARDPVVQFDPGAATKNEPAKPEDSKRASWLVEQSGTVERLDAGAKKLSLRTERRLIPSLQLDHEQFLAVDAEEARWKLVLVRGRSTAPELQSDSEVLDIKPHSGTAISSATPETEQAAAYQAVLDRLRSFALLRHDWDTYGALVPRPGAITDAEKFTLSLALGAGNSVPFAAPVPTGSVQLEWENQAAYLELEFFGKGEIKAFRVVEDEEILINPVERSRALELVRWFEGVK
jgi:hypothetical protein